MRRSATAAVAAAAAAAAAGTFMNLLEPNCQSIFSHPVIQFPKMTTSTTASSTTTSFPTAADQKRLSQKSERALIKYQTISSNSLANNNNNNNKNMDEGDQQPLTESERPYDIGQKGFLTKLERQLKELDEEADVLDVSSATGLDPHRQHNHHNHHNHHHHHRRYNYLLGKTDSSYQFNNLSKKNMSMESDAVGNLVLGETEPTYKSYFSKIQRDFQDIHLKDQNQSQTQQQPFHDETFLDETEEILPTMTHSKMMMRAQAVLTATTPPRRRHRILVSVATVIVLVFFSIVTWQNFILLQKYNTNNMTVTDSGRLEHNGMTVSTLGVGKIFPLKVIPSSSSSSPPDDHPYACLGLEQMIDMWTLTMLGSSTTVFLMHDGNMTKKNNGVATTTTTSIVQDDSNDHDNYHASEMDGLSGSGLGLQLTFHGATQNETHSCMATHDPNKKLCIDFTSSRCELDKRESSSDDNNNNSNNDDDNSDNTPDWKNLQHKRRQIFQTNLFGNKRQGLHEQCRNGQIGYKWCQSFAPIVLVGHHH